MSDYRDLIAYKKSYTLAMDIFLRTKKFPAEEKFGLTNQIRRSSRSVCANLVESYRRRKYKAHFVAKLTDSGAENAETQLWLDFSKDCEYLAIEEFSDFSFRNNEVGKLIWYMIENPEKFM
jgi:four helix bundle protein